MIITVTLNASIDKTTVINNFQIGKINRSDKPLEFAGGKGLNVSRALKNLDYNQSIATGFIGGKNGERLKTLIEKEKINHDFLEIEDETRSCLAIVDHEKNIITELNENGPEITSKELNDFFDKIEKLYPEAKIMVVAGSVPKSLPDSVYHDIVSIANKRGLITALDAKGVYLKNGIGAHPYIVKPNQYEAEELLGFRLNSKEDWLKGIYFLCHYCNIAVITLEGKGAIIGNKTEVYHFLPPQIKLVNSVGSGDSFMAGLIYAFLKNKDLKEMGIIATAAGTANAMTMQAGQFELNSINEIMKEIKIEKIL